MGLTAQAIEEPRLERDVCAGIEHVGLGGVLGVGPIEPAAREPARHCVAYVGEGVDPMMALVGVNA